MTPRIGVVYTASPLVHLYGNIATGFQTPQTSELIENPDLKSLTAYNYEVGMRFRSPKGNSLDLSVYSFKYSPRPGTAAAASADPVPPAEAQERLEELQALQRGLTLAYHRSRVGEPAEVLVEGPSRRSPGAGPLRQLQGRDAYHRVVNFLAGPGIGAGDLVPVTLVEATPHSLLGEPVGVQPRTLSADEFARPAGPA